MGSHRILFLHIELPLFQQTIYFHVAHPVLLTPRNTLFEFSLM